jgi:hypothetical protein
MLSGELMTVKKALSSPCRDALNGTRVAANQDPHF